MRIKYSTHGRERISERKITMGRISKTIDKPDEVLSSFRGRKLRRRRFGGKILEVVTKAEGKQIIVVTAYYLRED